MMKPYELDMVIMEFESLSNKSQLDFDAFEKEFNLFTGGKSLISAPAQRSHNMTSQNFSAFLSQHPAPQSQNFGFSAAS